MRSNIEQSSPKILNGSLSPGDRPRSVAPIPREPRTISVSLVVVQPAPNLLKQSALALRTSSSPAPGMTKASATFSPLTKSEAFFGGSGEPAFQIWVSIHSSKGVGGEEIFFLFSCAKETVSGWKEGKWRAGREDRGKKRFEEERKSEQRNKTKSSSLSLGLFCRERRTGSEAVSGKRPNRHGDTHRVSPLSKACAYSKLDCRQVLFRPSG